MQNDDKRRAADRVLRILDAATEAIGALPDRETWWDVELAVLQAANLTAQIKRRLPRPLPRRLA